MRPPVTQTAKPISIFRPGRHIAMSGQALAFSEADLAATAEAYDPELHEAPLTVGHPRHDAPAYGWVSRLQYSEDTLEAEPAQVDPAFAEMVRKGRFKKVSASFYPPSHPANPKPGVYYLRHVGFLGAQAPAVKGLKAVEFADEADGIVTIEAAIAVPGSRGTGASCPAFSEKEHWGFRAIANLLRNLRDRWIEKEGVEAADQLLPNYLISDIDRAAEEETDAAAPAFSEPQPSQQEEAMPDTRTDNGQTTDFAEKETELAAREQALAEREQALAEQAAAAHQREIADFAEQLEAEGRILPRQRPGIKAVLAAVDADQPLEFGEGDEQYKGTAGAWLREFLQTLPPQVDFAEHSAMEDETATADFAAPDGYTVDPAQLELHRKILAYAEEHNTDYAAAALAVGGNQ